MNEFEDDRIDNRNENVLVVGSSSLSSSSSSNSDSSQSISDSFSSESISSESISYSSESVSSSSSEDESIYGLFDEFTVFWDMNELYGDRADLKNNNKLT